MANTYEAYAIQGAIPLEADAYPAFLRVAIRNALKRVWVAQFLVNPYPFYDPAMAVIGMLKELAGCQRRNVDVRLILDKVRGSRNMHNANQLSYLAARKLGIPCHYYSGQRSSMHSKYVVIDDDLLVLGSHNFTDGALAQHAESSVGLFSADLADSLAEDFHRNWSEAEKAFKTKETCRDCQKGASKQAEALNA